MSLSLSPKFLHRLGQLSRTKAAVEFEFAARFPRQAQERKLASLLRANASTEVGRRHGFASIGTPQEYSQKLPLLRPSELLPQVKRLMAGERSILSAEPPVYYVRTSGSTGEPKHIPITAGYRKEFQRTVHVALYHLYRKFPEAFQGKALYFVGSRRVAKAGDGNDVGTMSGFNFTEMPPLIRAVYAWPYELFEVQDLPTRSFLSLALAVVEQPTLVAGIFPASIVYLFRDIERFGPELCETLRAGSLPGWLKLSAQEYRFFANKIGCRPELATQVERAIQLPRGKQVPALLPSLALIYCWNGATAGHYLPELRAHVGPSVAIRDAIYSACEGWCSIPMGGEGLGGPLAITSHFFEFFEVDDYDRGIARPQFAWELEEGAEYYIVPSTGSGLFRYFLGDIVKVTGKYHNTPCIHFVRKGGAAANLAGEKLVEAHMTEAVGAALDEQGLAGTYFSAAPIVDAEPPHYRLYLEVAGDEKPSAFAEAVDERLRTLSFDYDRVRASGHLGPLEVRLLSVGSYGAFRQACVERGGAESQLKVAHLVPELERIPALFR